MTDRRSLAFVGYHFRMDQPKINLREIEHRDAADIAELHADPDVQKYLGGQTNPERCETSIKGWRMKMRDRDQWYYAVVDENGRFVGVTTILHDGDDDGTYHVTLAVIKNRQKNGIGTAILTELLRLAKTLPEVKSLAALVEDDNTGSRKLFQRLDPNPTRKTTVKHLPEREVVEWTYKLY